MKVISNVIGFDDAPFAHAHRGNVRVVGAVCARTKLDGVLAGWVRRDGRNATDALLSLVAGSKFRRHIRAVMMHGIALAGFNVVDIHRLARQLGVPVLVTMRRQPRLSMIRDALLNHTPGGARKWQLVERSGPIEPAGPLWVQRVGLSQDEAIALLRATTLQGNLPEPLRLAHLIAGGMATDQSRGHA